MGGARQRRVIIPVAVAALVVALSGAALLTLLSLAISAAPAQHWYWPTDAGLAAISQATEASDADGTAASHRVALAQDAFKRNPLSVAALQALAAAASDSDSALASAAHRLILFRTKRSRESTAWLLQNSLKSRDVVAAIDAADMWLRQSKDGPGVSGVIDTLVALTYQGEASEIATKRLIDRLREKPNWAPEFLSTLARRGPPAQFPIIMDALVQPDEHGVAPAWEDYLRRLISIGLGQNAYSLWASLLPPDRITSLANVFNGSFEFNPVGGPFDWVLSKGRGYQSSIISQTAQDGSSSLMVAFAGGRIVFSPVYQMLILQRGLYQVRGYVKLNNVITPRGLRWRVYCIDKNNNKSVGESHLMSGSGDWTEFSFDIQIPAAGCETQMLRLELASRIDADREIVGVAWFDNVTVLPKDANP